MNNFDNIISINLFCIVLLSDLEIPAPGTAPAPDATSVNEPLSGPRLSLVMRGPNLPGIPDVSIPLNNIPAAAAVGQLHAYCSQQFGSASRLHSSPMSGHAKTGHGGPAVGTMEHSQELGRSTTTAATSNTSSSNTTPTNTSGHNIVAATDASSIVDEQLLSAATTSASSAPQQQSSSIIPPIVASSSSSPTVTPTSSRPSSANVGGSSPRVGGCGYVAPVPVLDGTQCLAASPDTTIFTAVQNLMNCVPFQSRQEKLRRIWEPTYV